jgi:hypothetical protein
MGNILNINRNEKEIHGIKILVDENFEACD